MIRSPAASSIRPDARFGMAGHGGFSPVAPQIAPYVAARASTTVRALRDRAAFGLLCLWTATGPSALRRQFEGPWDAGFAPERAA